MEVILLGFLTALGFCILLWKINLKFFAKYQWQTDLIISTALTFLFFGTQGGMLIAIIAGIFVSIFLYISSKILYL